MSIPPLISTFDAFGQPADDDGANARSVLLTVTNLGIATLIAVLGDLGWTVSWDEQYRRSTRDRDNANLLAAASRVMPRLGSETPEGRQFLSRYAANKWTRVLPAPRLYLACFATTFTLAAATMVP